jgi:predicted transcriptional regulator
MYKPKSVMEITAETKIPISTVYRRIQTLFDNKLLRTSGTITDDGKRLFLYKSKIKGIQSNFCNGQVEVEIILNK